MIVQTDVRGVSQNSSSDVEDWITQARHLQEDIERSKAVAREIVKEQEEGQGLSARVQDAKAKLELLQNETSFNSSVTLSLENTWAVDKDLNEAESTLTAGRLIELPANIQQLSSRISELAESNGKEINGGRISRLQDAVVDGLTSATISMVEYQKVDGQHHVTVNQGNHSQWPTCNAWHIADMSQHFWMFRLIACSMLLETLIPWMVQSVSSRGHFTGKSASHCCPAPRKPLHAQSTRRHTASHCPLETLGKTLRTC